MTESIVAVGVKTCSNPSCKHQTEQPFSNFYVRSGVVNPTLPGHYNSECKDCMKARSSNVMRLPLEESRVWTENVTIEYLKQQGIWSQTGKESNAPDVDVTAWGVVWIEVKHSRLKARGRQEEFTFMMTPKQVKRGLLADIVLLICEWLPETYTYHFFRSSDPVFYMRDRVKTGFTYRPGRRTALKHAGNRVVMTSVMMERARDNLDLIETVRLEHSESIRTSPFPHRRWREIESA